MNMEKTDAQQRNEDEVRRIMRERGFETALESKPKKKRRDFDFSIIGKVLAAIVVIGGLSFGVFALINAPKNDEVVKDTSGNEDTPQNADYAGLAVCLNAAYTDVEAGDPQFYPKLIASYKAQLDCHNQYPTPDNESEISDIKQRLGNVEIAAKDAGVSQTDIDSAYSSISSNLQKRLSEIDAEAAANDAETERKLRQYDEESAARNAEYEKQAAERATKETACANFTSQYPNVESYRNSKGNLTELWNNYQTAKSEYEQWVHIAYNPNANYSNTTNDANEKTLNMKKSAMDSAYSAYQSAYNSLTQQYNTEYRAACL